MKFLLDQDVYASTARFLNDLGHDAVPVAKIGLSQANDSDLLKTAREQDRIFVSRDRDFGGLVFVQVSVHEDCPSRIEWLHMCLDSGDGPVKFLNHASQEMTLAL